MKSCAPIPVIFFHMQNCVPPTFCYITYIRSPYQRWSIRGIQSIFVSSSSLTIFKTIPDPFQSLNTKGSIFKVSLQTYIYIIVINTCMLIFVSN